MSKHFSTDDDNAFRTIASELLALEAHAKRGLNEAEYVALAREVWLSCEKDSVYAIKLLFDPIVQPQFRENSESDLFCVLVARIDHTGELVNAPPGYTPPDYPGVRLSQVVAGSPSGGNEPDTSQAQTYLLAYFDVLGFEALLTRVGLAEVHKRYLSLLDQALRPQSHERPWSRAKSIVSGQVVPAMMWLPMHAAHFSDSLLLWVHYHPGHVEEFLNRCARVFCKALDLGVPLRGAITVGDSVLDNTSNIFLGAPLVEAARLESKQDWVGVALGTSFKSKSLRIPIPPDPRFSWRTDGVLYGQKLAAPALMRIRLNIVSPNMKRTAGKLLGLLVVVFATSGTSCSCYEVRLSDQEAANVGRLIGTSIQAKKDLIGMLGEHIDDNHKFGESKGGRPLNLTPI